MAKVDVDEKTLQTVAGATGGNFYRATDTDSLEKIYGQINRLEKTAQTVQKFEHHDELYSWALIPARWNSRVRLAAAADALPEAAVSFSHPAWLARAAWPPVCAAPLALAPLRCRQHAALARFVSAHLRSQLTRSVSIGRRRVQRGLFLAALALLFVALAGPQVGFHWEQVSRRGIEIIFAVDTSRSMSTPDVTRPADARQARHR